MPRYFFDTRDGDVLLMDEEGCELTNLEAAKKAAATSLAELAADVIPTSADRVLIVSVRDERGPVLESRLTFETIALVRSPGADTGSRVR